MKKIKFFRLLWVVFVAMILLPVKEVTGQIPYCIYDKATQTLTLKSGSEIPNGAKAFDENPGKIIDDSGDDVEPGQGSSHVILVPVSGYSAKKIIIDPSFANFKPKTCAYWFCSQNIGFDLEEIKGQNNINTSDVTDMSHMFEGNGHLTILDLSGLNTANVTNMNRLFSGCGNLTTIFVNNTWNTSNVNSSEYMFYNCSKLIGEKGTRCNGSSSAESISFAQIDAGKSSAGYFTQIGHSPFKFVSPYAVFDNGTLTLGYDSNGKPDGSFEINDVFEYTVFENEGNNWHDVDTYIAYNIVKAENVRKIIIDKSFANYTPIVCRQWFYGCSNLTDIQGLEYLNTSNVTDMGMMFEGCSNLTSLNLSNFNTSSVSDLNNMFSGCSNLKTIWVGDGWNTSSLSSHRNRYVFYNCTSIVGGNGTLFNSDQTSISYAHIDGGEDNPGYFSKAGEPMYVPTEAYAVFNDGTLTFKYDGNKPEGAYNMTTGSYWNYFEEWGAVNTNIKQVIFDKSFADYRPVTCAYWFYNCENLTEIQGIENLNTDEVTNMSNMFAFCESLKRLDLSNFNTAKVTDMSGMFQMQYIGNLTTIYIGNKWNVSNVSESEDMFSGCYRLHGGQGTIAMKSDIKYARIDMRDSYLPGYFTKKGETPIIPYCVVVGKNEGDYSKVILKTGSELPDYAYLIGELPVKKTSLTKSVIETDGDSFVMEPLLYGVKEIEIDPSFYNYLPYSLSRWFSCGTVESIKGLEYVNTSKVIDMSGMFGGCAALGSLDLSNFNIQNVTDMSNMFKDCRSLETIFVSDKWATKSITKSNLMFDGCSNLVGGKGTQYDENHIDYTYAHIDGGESNPGYFTKAGQEPYNVAEPYAVFDNGTLTFYYDGKKPKNAFKMKTSTDDEWTSIASDITKVVFDNAFSEYRPTSCEYWFLYCSNLTEIEGMKNLNTEDVTSIRSMFNMCEKLESIDLSSFDTKNVTNMRCTFYGCNNLKALDLSKFKTDKVTTMYSMFKYCENLTNLDLSSFNTKNVTDMSYMLDSCINLKTVDLSSFNTQNVTDMHRMFAYCHNLTNVNLQGFNTANVEYMNHLFYHCNNLASLDLSKFNTGKVTNMKSMFCYCNNLKTLDLSSFNTKNVTDMSYMLDSCVNLKTVDLSSFNTKNVTNMCGIFEYCNNLATIDLSNFDTKNVTNMGFMFDNCKKLQNIDLSNFDTRNVTSMRAMFQHCDNLKNLDLEGFDTKNVEDMAGMFGLCKNLVNINCNGFETKFVTNMRSMFAGCNSLTIIDLGSFNTERVENMENIFYNCTNLTTIYVGDNWSTSSVTESKNMFSKCTSLVGGKGTVFNSGKTDKSYARIDGGKNNPGYFTKSGEKPYDVSTPVSELSVNSNIKIWSFEKSIYIDNAVANISIVDIYGRHIKTIRAISDHIEIPMIKSGVYIVKTGVATQKVIIQ
jgi:surface protein